MSESKGYFTGELELASAPITGSKWSDVIQVQKGIYLGPQIPHLATLSNRREDRIKMGSDVDSEKSPPVEHMHKKFSGEILQHNNEK